MINKQLSPLNLDYGSTVFYRGKRYLVHQESSDFETVVLVEPGSAHLVEAAIRELSPVELLRPATTQDLVELNAEEMERAYIKYEAIKPLLDSPGYTKNDVIARAEEKEIHHVTLYRWIKQFQDAGKISAFVRAVRKDKGRSLIEDEIEQIMSDFIESKYLTKQQRSVASVYRKIDKACKKKGLKSPHLNTVRNRIKSLSAYKKMKARRGGKEARDAYAQQKGRFPGADVPLAVVQVDHTPVDIILVDDLFREPIGRPWLTLLMDVYSRMVLGFYISFDPPGNLSLGLCLTHAFLPKEAWLAKFDIETSWPCWGLPRTIHADNAKEFRGNMLKMACKEYGMDLEWRPVATPHYGAHIERLLGTLSKEIHEAPGSTFSNPKGKGEYDSDKQSAMSLSEFERWFVNLCVGPYHHRRHSELGIPPIEKWKEGVLGTKKKPGIGLPTRITDELRLKLDLMPFERRTVRQSGIRWDHIDYQHDVLRPWVNSLDPEIPKKKRKFLCRRDPRDISIIWFYDPEVQQYYSIPYRNTSHPAISIWELREAQKRIKQEHAAVEVDEQLIFDAYDEMRRIEDEAKKTTRKARRNQERHRVGLENSQKHVQVPDPPDTPEPTVDNGSTLVRDLQPFDDFDDMQGEDDD